MKKGLKITLIVLGILVVVIIAGGVVIYGLAVGFTKEAKYNNCMETCDEMLIMESSKAYCDDECTRVTGYTPTEKYIEDDSQAEEINTETTTTPTTKTESNSSTTSSSTSTSNSSKTSTTTSTDLKDLEYYCEWSWPQNIIDKNTKKIIQRCNSERPYCKKTDDYKYENTGCCEMAVEGEYYDCQSLDSLLNN
ncbi:MAG: hypothetical protein ABIE68_03625 [bacterium]